MANIPVIVGFGGINPAGRMSSHLAYQRLVIDHLDAAKQDQTYRSLAQLMGLAEEDSQSEKVRESIRVGTLVRELEKSTCDSHKIYSHRKLEAVSPDGNSDTSGLSFCINEKNLPKKVPSHWILDYLKDGKVQVTVQGDQTFFMPKTRKSTVNVAGQLPAGLDLTKLYSSRGHPRGLQMATFAMSDALGHLGLDWQQLKRKVPLDQISVYAGSAISQMDEMSGAGLLQSRLLGVRPTSKQLAFLLADMPANFVNAYVLGHMGTTGNNQGACAGFLYNLRQGMLDIRDGRARIAVVGASEAGITPEIMEGFSSMGALSTDQDLMELGNGEIDYTRASRPFGDNRGFVIGEAAQYFILMDDELALELGANIHGGVADVFINADGFKRSISSPGVGNYITVAKAMAITKAIVGEASMKRSYVLAHGTGTPQNRVTESQILNRVAKDFGFEKLPVVATKCYVGHSVASSSGEQLSVAMGVWNQGLLPGIVSHDKLAHDVETSHLDFVLNTRQVDSASIDATLINSKGFGGNNATASILAPHIIKDMLKKKHGQKIFNAYEAKNEMVAQSTETFKQSCLNDIPKVHYSIDEKIMGDEDIRSDSSQISLSDYRVQLPTVNPYAEFNQSVKK